MHCHLSERGLPQVMKSDDLRKRKQALEEEERVRWGSHHTWEEEIAVPPPLLLLGREERQPAGDARESLGQTVQTQALQSDRCRAESKYRFAVKMVANRFHRK
jgi:hypothetical protein